MEKFRKKIQLRTAALMILTLIAITIELVDVFWAQEQIKAPVVGFQCGVAASVAIMSAICIVKYSRALRNDKKLEILYNKENDERMKYIRSKAGLPFIWISSVVMILVGIVAGYFNSVIFYTLIASAALQLIMSCVVKFVYMKIS